MEYTEVKQILNNCRDLRELDAAAFASLLWRGVEMTLGAGTVIYSEGTPSDDTFCLLLSGHLLVEQKRVTVGEIPVQEVFGEMAYFTRARRRTATVRVESQSASILKFPLTSTELSFPGFEPLKELLGDIAWDRFVSESQRAP